VAAKPRAGQARQESPGIKASNENTAAILSAVQEAGKAAADAATAAATTAATAATVAAIAHHTAEDALQFGELNRRHDKLAHDVGELKLGFASLEATVAKGNKDTAAVLGLVSSAKAGAGVLRWIGGMALAVIAWLAYYYPHK
jgi:hypothetical protein